MTNEFVNMIESKLHDFLWKLVKHAGTAAAGFASALLAKKLGVTLSDANVLEIAAVVSGILGGILNWVKRKWPLKFGWL
jgi:hypothetical protein